MEAEQWCLVRQEELDMIRRKDILGNCRRLMCNTQLLKLLFVNVQGAAKKVDP